MPIFRKFLPSPCLDFTSKTGSTSPSIFRYLETVTKWKEHKDSPGAPTPQLWSELTCPPVQLPFSPTGMGRLLAGPQSCVCSSQGHLNDLPERLKSEPQTTQWVYVVNVWILRHHISHQDSGTLDFTHRRPYSPLPFIWENSTAFPAFSPESCFGPWEPGWPWEPLLRDKVWMTQCTPTGWVTAVLHVGKRMSTGQVRRARGWSRQCPGARQVFLNFSFPISKSQWPDSPPLVEETVFFFSPPLCVPFTFNSAF